MSHQVLTEEAFYDPDDVLPRSPLLEPIKPVLKPEPSPPPFLPTSPSSSAESEGGDTELARESEVGKKAKPSRRRKKGKKKKHVPSQGDTVLLNYLEPNRPDIAAKAGESVLNSASQSEDEEGKEGKEGVVEEMNGGRRPKNGIHHSPSEDRLKTQAVEALAAVRDDDPEDDDLDMVDAARDQWPEVKAETHDAPPTNGVLHNHHHHHDAPEPSKEFTTLSPLSSARTGYDTKPPPKLPPPLPPPITTETARPPGDRSRDEDSTPISPILAKYVINPSEAHPESILPAMQKSPPRSASTHSPEGSQSLPSLQTTLHGINAPSPFQSAPAHSPQFVRHPTFSSQSTGPSPGAYSHPSPGMSPPGYPSHPSYWRRQPTEGAMSTPSTYDASTPASVPGPSPAQSYPTPNVQDHRGSVDGSATPQLLNGPLQPNGPFTSSTFKCTYPGCTAAPFQTQYLLNSHANVHSSNRPHFCGVPECPRGPGGKGFKRKNEMIRHGLVHQSPGYICPFCPDQQHRYPRPDNLQRHVRVHHMDKERDDPELRRVLAQRPEGGNRGRRRRAGG